MLIIILLGIATSVAAEVVTALNAKLNKTILKGDGAFMVAFALALIGAMVKEMTVPGFQFSTLAHWSTLSATFSEVFAISQVYFLFVVKKLSLDVGSTPIQIQTPKPAALEPVSQPSTPQ